MAGQIAEPELVEHFAEAFDEKLEIAVDFLEADR